jgi:hypothetical protein
MNASKSVSLRVFRSGRKFRQDGLKKEFDTQRIESSTADLRLFGQADRAYVAIRAETDFQNEERAIVWKQSFAATLNQALLAVVSNSIRATLPMRSIRGDMKFI